MQSVLYEGKFLQLVKSGRWEFVERKQAQGVVVIIPKLNDGRWLLIEQHREPVAGRCIEFPAGLVGDTSEYVGEQLADAAGRELLEETGYQAERLQHIGHAAPTPGLTSEVMDFFLATGLTQVNEGGGVGEEDIQTHLISEQEIHAWLSAQAQQKVISSMVYCGLYLAKSV